MATTVTSTSPMATVSHKAKPKVRAGTHSSLLVGGAAGGQGGEHRGGEGRGGQGPHTALLLGAWPLELGYSGNQDPGGIPGPGMEGGGPLLEPGSQPLWVCGAWVVRAHRDLGRPHFFSLPSEGRQGLPVSPVEVRGQRWQDYSSAPRTERWSDS